MMIAGNTPFWRSSIGGRWPLFAVLAGFASGCALPPPVPERVLPGLRYTFVVLGEEGRPIARAITADAACPAISFDGMVQPMDVRARPGMFPARMALGAPIDEKPYAFPVLTCEKAIPPGVARAVVDGRVLPLPKAKPQRIVLVGDTGCRLTNIGGVYQNCNDALAWPFRMVAYAAADTLPDLVIHVGDYHYREAPCPAGNAGCEGSPWGYGWDVWEADFFAPGARLLAAAPLVVVRGNHETCSRAGQGWWRFLDPRPLMPHQDCIDPADDSIGNYSEPYAVPLGAGSDADTQFIVFDSSFTGVVPLKPTDLMYRNYYTELQRAFADAARRPSNFFVAHHPVLGFAPNPAKPEAPYPGNVGLQSVLQALQPDTLFPPSVQAVLGGHVHIFEVVSFATGQPPQVVSGTGGDWLDASFPSPFPASATPAPGAVVASIVARSAFGFMTMGRVGATWTMVARDINGTPVTVCKLVERKITCGPAPGT